MRSFAFERYAKSMFRRYSRVSEQSSQRLVRGGNLLFFTDQSTMKVEMKVETYLASPSFTLLFPSGSMAEASSL